MTSLIPVSRLTPSDLARLGNNLPRRRRRSILPQFWHTEAVRRSLAVHEPDFCDESMTGGGPDLSDCLA